MSQIVIVGAGKIADEAYFYLTNDSPHEVVAFSVDRAFVGGGEKMGLPVVPFEDVERDYPPDRFRMFVAIGYQDLNRLRAQKYEAAKAKGYELISYVSSRAANVGNVQFGDNCLILEFVTLQPCTRVGSNVSLWPGVVVGHHATIGDHCYLTAGAIVAGNSVIEPYCFLGVHASVGHEIVVGERSFLGAGTVVTKNVPPASVYIEPDTARFRLDADSFLRLTKMK
jgi:sugar O-acyltransferase (sialic acid O-acetyltransferase NeuD family)